MPPSSLRFLPQGCHLAAAPVRHNVVVNGVTVFVPDHVCIFGVIDPTVPNDIQFPEGL